MLPPVSAPAAPAQAPAAVIAVVEVAAAAVVAVWRRRQRPQALCCRPGEIQKNIKFTIYLEMGKSVRLTCLTSPTMWDSVDVEGCCCCCLPEDFRRRRGGASSM